MERKCDLSGGKTLVSNRRARHEYEILQSFEAGMELAGTEIKSLRLGKANLTEGWVDIDEGEAFLRDVHISPYSHGNIMNHMETRARRLLLHKREIHKLQHTLMTKGLTLIPLKIYLKRERAKLEVALARGKKMHDKRDTQRKRDADRQMAQALREKNR